MCHIGFHAFMAACLCVLRQSTHVTRTDDTCFVSIVPLYVNTWSTSSTSWSTCQRSIWWTAYWRTLPSCRYMWQNHRATGIHTVCVCVCSFTVMVENYGPISLYIVLCMWHIKQHLFGFHSLAGICCTCNLLQLQLWYGPPVQLSSMCPGVFFDFQSVFALIPLLETVSNKIAPD